MDIINQIVERLSKDELRYLNMRYKGEEGSRERKDMKLLNLIRKQGHKFNEAEALKYLGYSTADKNSYYRLKNRVIEDVSEGLSLLYTSKTPALQLQHYLAIHHIYYDRHLYKVCLYYLKRAEKLARNIESYELLDVIYDALIRLSFHITEINPQQYTKLRRDNMRLVSQLRELDDRFAEVYYKLKLTQNFAATDKKLLQALMDNAKDIAAQTTSQYSKSLQTRIYRALSQVFLQLHNYAELEVLVKRSFATFEKEKWFDKDNHDLKLHMLTYAGNALYKNGKYKESVQYAEKLGAAILEYGRAYYDKFLFFYYNLLIVNNAVLNPDKALEHLRDFEQQMRRKKNFYHDTFIYLNRAGLLYDRGQYKDALKALVRLYVSDDYAKANSAFKLKVEVSELVITYEAGDMEAVTRRAIQIEKDYIAFKKQSSFAFDFAIVDLLKQMAVSKSYLRDSHIQKMINKLLRAKLPVEAEDSEIVRYKGWLNQKKA